MAGRRTPYDPERALDEVAPGAIVVTRELDGCAGLVEPGPPPEVSIDYRLGRRERRCVLTHEVKHIQLDLWYDAGSRPALVSKLESIVRHAVLDELVPLDELEVLVDGIVDDGGAVTGHVVSEVFDVTLDLAIEALVDLQLRRRGHPRARRPTARRLR